MVPRLALLMLLSGSLASCGSTLGSMMPPSVSEYCTLTKGDLPIRLSRKDTPATQRDVAIVNAKHKQRCKGD